MEENTPHTWSISTSGAEIIRLTSVISEYINTIKDLKFSENTVLLESNHEFPTGKQSDISNMYLYVNSIGSIISCAIVNIVKIAAAAESKQSCCITSGENQYLFEPTDLLYSEVELLRKLHRIYMVTRYDILNPLSVISGYELLLQSSQFQKKLLIAEYNLRYQNSLESFRLKINSTVSLLRPVFDTSIPLCKRKELFKSSFSKLLQSESFL